MEKEAEIKRALKITKEAEQIVSDYGICSDAKDAEEVFTCTVPECWYCRLVRVVDDCE